MKNGNLNVNKWGIRKVKTENIYCEIHDRIDKMNCEEEYKTGVIITLYEKLLYSVFSCDRVCR